MGETSGVAWSEVGSDPRRRVGWRAMLALPAAGAAGLAAAAWVIAGRGLREDAVWYSVWAVAALAVCGGIVGVAGRDDRRLAVAAATFGFAAGLGREVAGPAAVLEFVLYMGGMGWLISEMRRYRL